MMKIVAMIARLLLGLMFLVFGLNIFLGFIPAGPPLTGTAREFVGALGQSHLIWVVAALQIAGGLLLLINRFVPLGLVLLGPVIVNIFLFHVLMAPRGIGPAIVAVVLWLIVFYRHRQSFAGIFAAKA
jgi:uncharacterized membrane protein YphA (DoxX/SURF4 family)